MRKRVDVNERTHTWLCESGLKIVGSSWGDDASPSIVLLHGGGRKRGFESLDEVVLAISAYRGEPTRRPSMEGLAKAVRLGSDGRYYWHWDPNFLEERERDFEARYDRLSACAKRVEIPTLVVRGGSSDVVSEEGVKEFLRLCPHAEYLNIAEAGHMVTGDENDSFGQATIDFLGRNVPASSMQ
jgi:non-heme chloroperoxidase